jgi:uncharacterized protein
MARKGATPKSMNHSIPTIDELAVRRLWFWRQRLHAPFSSKLTKRSFVAFLNATKGLQLDSVNVLERAHYLTLWSRFGPYSKGRVDAWIHRDRVAYEYWGHAASVLPASQLPLSLRAQRCFRARGTWWGARIPSDATLKRVLARIRRQGPLESADFENREGEGGGWWDWKEDKQALELLWYRGKLATSERRSFRRVYDLASRVYPKATPATLKQLEDSWLFGGLQANGVAPARHLYGYLTSPLLGAADRRRIIERNLENRRIVQVKVNGHEGPWFALPEHLDMLRKAPEPVGTTLLCPFDSLLWQRDRAEELLGFRYRIEIYTPPAKRIYGYYCMPILHDGELVGLVDPKLHRDRAQLEVRSVHLEPTFRRSASFDRALSGVLESLATFVDASSLVLPKGY